MKKFKQIQQRFDQQPPRDRALTGQLAYAGIGLMLALHYMIMFQY